MNIQKWPEISFCPKRCTIFWNVYKNNFPIFEFWEMVDFVFKIYIENCQNKQPNWPNLILSQEMRNVLKCMQKKKSDLKKKFIKQNFHLKFSRKSYSETLTSATRYSVSSYSIQKHLGPGGGKKRNTQKIVYKYGQTFIKYFTGKYEAFFINFRLKPLKCIYKHIYSLNNTSKSI